MWRNGAERKTKGKERIGMEGARARLAGRASPAAALSTEMHLAGEIALARHTGREPRDQ